MRHLLALLLLLPSLTLSGCTEKGTENPDAGDLADGGDDSDGGDDDDDDDDGGTDDDDDGGTDAGTTPPTNHTWTLGSTTYVGTLKQCATSSGTYTMLEYTGQPNEQIQVHLPSKPTTAGTYTLVQSPNGLGANEGHIAIYVQGASGGEFWDSSSGTLSITMNGTKPSASFTNVPMVKPGSTSTSTASGVISCP